MTNLLLCIYMLYCGRNELHMSTMREILLQTNL